MQTLEFQLRTRLVFAPGAVRRAGEIASELGFRHSLLVADRGLTATGHINKVIAPLRDSGVAISTFTDFDTDPDSSEIEAGRAFAAPLGIDSIIALGGGSSMDCAKGINLLLTNGGCIQDYWGYGQVEQPLLPMIAVPTTAGTGSEAQSYALISNAKTHVKMACGDPKAAFRLALLDPTLTVSQPFKVTAAAGFDAIAHAVETYVTTKRNAFSDAFAREAWLLLEHNYERVLAEPQDVEARGAMQLGACFAGLAIENSMLGATHACANPLTARYGTTHGEAIAMLLPAVVRWNGSIANERYADLLKLSSQASVVVDAPTEHLARRLEELAQAGGLLKSLRNAGVLQSDLPLLADDAAKQWTGKFNPRSFDSSGAMEVYQCAY